MMGKDLISILIIGNDEVTQKQIAQLFPATSGIYHLKTATDTDDALLKIIDQDPDLVFLEYPTIGKTGNAIIKFMQSKHPNTTIVLISKSEEYAIEAIHHEIYNYLVKPVKVTELNRIIEKVKQKKSNSSLLKINEIIEKNQEEIRLRFNTIKGFVIISPEELLYCKAAGPYSNLHFTNDSVEMVFSNLSKIEEILKPYNFIRVSRSIIVNKNYIRKVYLNENKLVLLSNGKELEISGTRLIIKELAKIY